MSYYDDTQETIFKLNEFLSGLDSDWLYQKYYYLTNPSRAEPINSDELLDSIFNGYFGLILYKHDSIVFELLKRQLNELNE